MAQGKSCVYFESFEKLFNELPNDQMRVEFHRALINRGLYNIPFPSVPRETYWDGRLSEAFEYAEQLFSSNEAKREAGKKGGSQKNKGCLKHASSNVNVNDNVNVNGNANANANDNGNALPMASGLKAKATALATADDDEELIEMFEVDENNVETRTMITKKEARERYGYKG